ncbi:hypothetical protein BDP27DRAFT_1227722 [Rhodocollybia butyracea]|uniref:Uncharacterized protein n=1 Tax=Rhodocollybia butyracea TaxID=206335 RepID=A0A9P5PIX9_9AGAR|nr:hypothetical protein BDP27DRAFT_1227722 [Rhodocollybia butyracea]
MLRALRARNFSKRPTENTPPVKSTTKSRRSNTRKPKSAARFDAEQAKKRASKNKTVRLNVVVYANAPDVQMGDAHTPVAPTVIPVQLPRIFQQPPVCEPSAEALAAATRPPYNGQPAAFVRDAIEDCGPRSLKTLCSVSTQVDNAILPKELAIVVNDLSATDYPTHMLAVYAPVPKRPDHAPASWTPPRTEVKMYPVHAIFMAAHCAKLGPFPASPTLSQDFDASPSSSGTPRTITIPVRPLCLPSPATFPTLLRYFYLRRPEILLAHFLPCPFSSEFVQDPLAEENIRVMAQQIGETFNPTTILRYAKTIQGVWQNACALGAFDEGLWAAIDACYEILLQALAIGTGNPRAVYVARTPEPI